MGFPSYRLAGGSIFPVDRLILEGATRLTREG